MFCLQNLTWTVWQLLSLFSAPNLRAGCTNQHFQVGSRCPWICWSGFLRFWGCGQRLTLRLSLYQYQLWGSHLFQRGFQYIFAWLRMLIFLHIKKKNNRDIKTQVHHDTFINNSQRGVEIHCIFLGSSKSRVPVVLWTNESLLWNHFFVCSLRLGSCGIYFSGNFPFPSSEANTIKTRYALMHNREL